MEGILNMICLSPAICPFLVCSVLFANSREQLNELRKYALTLMDPCHKNYYLNLGSEDVRGSNLICLCNIFIKDSMSYSLTKACVSLLPGKGPCWSGIHFAQMWSNVSLYYNLGQDFVVYNPVNCMGLL